MHSLLLPACMYLLIVYFKAKTSFSYYVTRCGVDTCLISTCLSSSRLSCLIIIINISSDLMTINRTCVNRVDRLAIKNSHNKLSVVNKMMIHTRLD